MQQFRVHPIVAVKDLEVAREFYSKKLGLEVQADYSPEGIFFQSGDGTRFFVYPKDDFQPASHNVLGWEVADIAKVVQELRALGIQIEKVDGTDDRGIMEQGPMKAAWFKDPDGNWLCINEGV